jgi:uncharacterized repeat protein (TIGR03803 family)
VVHPADADYRILHSFSGAPADGQNSLGALIHSGPTLYGETLLGGDTNIGTVFGIETDGSGFGILHSLQVDDGWYPVRSLSQSGDILFGTTSGGGGIHPHGTIFSLSSDGSEFHVLHAFNFERNDGQIPVGSLIQDGQTLFGLSAEGRAEFSYGTVYAINTDGSGFRLLHSFAAGNGGSNPQAGLVRSGASLYGMTAHGGDGGGGTIFSIAEDGSNFRVLHSFAPQTDGQMPYGPLTLSGSMLYGTTSQDGNGGGGTVFSIALDGSGFQVLHAFSGADGLLPWCTLMQSGSTLYGTTALGGSANDGVVFGVETDGSNFQLLHTFTGGPDDGWGPIGSLILSDSTFYGVTQYGGTSDFGTVFAMDLPEPSVLAAAVTVILLARRRRPTTDPSNSCRLRSWHPAVTRF